MRRAYSARSGVSDVHAAASAGKRSTRRASFASFASLASRTRRPGESARRHAGARGVRARADDLGGRRARGAADGGGDGRARDAGRGAARDGSGRRRRVRRAGVEQRGGDHAGPHHDGARDVLQRGATSVRHASSVCAHETARQAGRLQTVKGSRRRGAPSPSAATKGSTFVWSPRTHSAAAPQPPAQVGACSHPAQ